MPNPSPPLFAAYREKWMVWSSVLRGFSGLAFSEGKTYHWIAVSGFTPLTFTQMQVDRVVSGNKL